MPVTAEQFRNQVLGSISALEKLPAKERETKPSATFATHYNGLLALSKEVMPDVDPRRWPSESPIHTPSMGQASSELRFTEIHAFMEQLSSILAEGIQY